MENHYCSSSDANGAQPPSGTFSSTESAHRQESTSVEEDHEHNSLAADGPSSNEQTTKDAGTGGEGETSHSAQGKDDASTGEDVGNDEDTAPSPRTMKAVDFFRLL